MNGLLNKITEGNDILWIMEFESNMSFGRPNLCLKQVIRGYGKTNFAWEPRVENSF